MYVEAYVRVCIRGKKRKRNAVSTSVSRRVKWDSMDTAPPRHRRLYGLVCLALFHSSDDRLQSTKLMHMCMSPRVFISRKVFLCSFFFGVPLFVLFIAPSILSSNLLFRFFFSFVVRFPISEKKKENKIGSKKEGRSRKTSRPNANKDPT